MTEPLQFCLIATAPPERTPMALPPVFQDRLRLPAVAAPLFLISGPELVVAQCISGVVGTFPSLNARPQPVFKDWLVRINEALAEHDADHPDRPAAPYGVNLIVHRSNDRLAQDLDTIVEFQVP